MQEKSVYPYDHFLVAIMLILATILFAVQRKYTIVFVITLFTISSLIYLATIFVSPSPQVKRYTGAANIAYIDTSHLERINLDLWGEPDGFGGLIYNLSRNGYFPQVLKTFNEDRIASAGMLIIIAPAKPFTEREIETIGKFVQNGGFLIVAVGWEEKDASVGLLEHFGLRIGNTPLGRISPAQNDKGLSFYKSWPVIDNEERSEVLCKIWNYPTAVYHPYDNGGVLLVGDSSFLLNRNLEGLHDYFLANIMFLKEVFSTRFNVGGSR
jgi:hypothetical protein